MSDVDLLNQFVGEARARAVEQPWQSFGAAASRPDAGMGAPAEEKLPGGVRLPGDVDLGDGSSFLLSVAKEVLIRTPGTPAMGENFDFAAGQLAAVLRAGYTDAARREMDLGTWLRNVFGVPPQVKTLEELRDSIVAVLTGSEVADLLRVVADLPQEVIDARYTPEDAGGTETSGEEQTRPLAPQRSGAAPAMAAAPLGPSNSPPPAPGPTGTLYEISGPPDFERVKIWLEYLYKGSSKKLNWVPWRNRYFEAREASKRPLAMFELKPTMIDGLLVHLVLQEAYRRSRPFNEVVIERYAYPYGLFEQGRLLRMLAEEQPQSKYAALHNALANIRGMANRRTDITDFTAGEMYEIKSRSSADKAVLQLWGYLEHYNHLAEVFKVKPTDLKPGTTWKPETRIPAIPLGFIGKRPKVAFPFTVPGLPGLVLYSVFLMPSEDERQRARRALENELIKQSLINLIIFAVMVALLIIGVGYSIYLQGLRAATLAATTEAAAGATVIPITSATTVTASTVVANMAKAAAVSWFVLGAGGAVPALRQDL